MGITGELVRSVFSRSRSVQTHETSGRSNVVDKRRWSSVRSYLCGYDISSVLAEESASVRNSYSSEVTVTQPMAEEALLVVGGINVQRRATRDTTPNEKRNSMSKLLQKDDAALVIQAAFRSFLARRRQRGGANQETVGAKSPSRESISTSIEVQTGNSMEVLTAREESVAVRVQQKSRSQASRQKEGWDHSTVSSNVSKMRQQNRLEATTRRERALAYAFAQQLRTCTKKRQARSIGTETNMSWSWLERWMATRVPDSSLVGVEDPANKQIEDSTGCSRVLMVNKKFFDVGAEEESCGSNEVSVKIDLFSVTGPKGEGGNRPSKSRHKSTQSMSRQKTMPERVDKGSSTSSAPFYLYA